MEKLKLWPPNREQETPVPLQQEDPEAIRKKIIIELNLALAPGHYTPSEYEEAENVLKRAFKITENDPQILKKLEDIARNYEAQSKSDPDSIIYDEHLVNIILDWVNKRVR